MNDAPRTASLELPPVTAGRARGELFTLTAGEYRAEISAVGAILESVTVGGRDLLVRSPETGPMLFYRGAIVADRKSTRLNSSHVSISYAVFCLKKKKKTTQYTA